MMKVVLDTNVIVSAFLSPAGMSAAILRLVLNRELEICSNTAILAEYEEVLCRPKFAGKIHRQAVMRFFDIIRDIGCNVDAPVSQIDLPDEGDRKFYDSAMAVGAILITGNKKHYPDKPNICDPAEFFSNQEKLR